MAPKYRNETEEALASEAPEIRPFEFEGHDPVETRPGVSPHQFAARGLGDMFSLHPGAAFLTVVVNAMVDSAVVASAGLLLPLSFGAGLVLGIIVYKMQKEWQGDSEESARIKGLIAFLLSAIPSPLPYVLFIPAGLLGWLRRR